jgi:hypothetical protein
MVLVHAFCMYTRVMIHSEGPHGIDIRPMILQISAIKAFGGVASHCQNAIVVCLKTYKLVVLIQDNSDTAHLHCMT